jgi:hypothetical protein
MLLLLEFNFKELYDSSNGVWWLKPVILATQEAEIWIWRITVQSQPKQNIHEIPISANGWVPPVVGACYPSYMQKHK